MWRGLKPVSHHALKITFPVDDAVGSKGGKLVDQSLLRDVDYNTSLVVWRCYGTSCLVIKNLKLMFVFLPTSISQVSLTHVGYNISIFMNA